MQDEKYVDRNINKFVEYTKKFDVVDQKKIVEIVFKETRKVRHTNVNAEKKLQIFMGVLNGLLDNGTAGAKQYIVDFCFHLSANVSCQI